MNLLGKIFVVAILIASLVFMTLSMAVYATHTNWYVRSGALETQLQEQRAENTQLKDRYNSLQTRLEAEKAHLTQQLVKADTHLTGLQQEHTEISQEIARLQAEQGTAIAAVTAAEDQNKRLNEQRDALLAQVREQQSKTDQFFQIAKNATLELQQLLGIRSNLEEQLDQLLPQLAQFKAAFRSVPSDYAPDVDGVIRVVRQEGAQKLIEVSIGSDDGLQRGTELLIYRGGSFLGKAKVKDTRPDEAVCEVIPGSVEGNIQAGDRVATRV